jgi:UDP-N-acetylglucosamine 2-epimerase
MKVVSIVGARPQFIKAATVSAALRKRHKEVLVHTGQHYDYGMSAVFFEELKLPAPEYNLGVGSQRHGAQTAEMLMRIEELLYAETPDWVLVYGDTNSTIAGALAASKLNIPLAHVEAGLRSFNRAMPEEINRVVTDHLSRLLFCPSGGAAVNLKQENIMKGVHVVGDVMYDAILRFLPAARANEKIIRELEVTPKQYLLATVHRAANTDDSDRLVAILNCLASTNYPVVFPVHPRTAKVMEINGLTPPENVKLIEPVSYFSMLSLESQAKAILTDSGGVQKEALWLGVPCITLREETEWTETVEAGWNHLVGIDAERVRAALAQSVPDGVPPTLYGDGRAAQHIAALLERG